MENSPIKTCLNQIFHIYYSLLYQSSFDCILIKQYYVNRNQTDHWIEYDCEVRTVLVPNNLIIWNCMYRMLMGMYTLVILFLWLDFVFMNIVVQSCHFYSFPSCLLSSANWIQYRYLFIKEWRRRELAREVRSTSLIIDPCWKRFWLPCAAVVDCRFQDWRVWI